MRSGRMSITLSIILLLLFSTGVAAQSPLPTEVLSLSRQANPIELNSGEETEIHVTLTSEDRIECVTTHPVDVVLLIDTSTSMGHDRKIAAARNAAGEFATSMDYQTDRVAVVAFAKKAAIIQAFSGDRKSIESSIASLSTSTLDGSETNIDLGLMKALRVFDNRRSQAMTSVVLLSDGESNRTKASEAASEMKDQGIEIFSISLGEAADQSLMSDLASAPNDAHHYHAPTSSDLATIYTSVRQQIQADIQDITFTLDYDKSHLELIPQSITPSAKIEDATLIWSLSTLAPNETQKFKFRVRARQEGKFPASPSAYAEFEVCDGQIADQNFGADATVSILPPPPPLAPLTLPCTTVGLPWWVCLLLLLLLLLGALFWWLWRQREKRHQEIQSHVQPWAGLSSPSLESSAWDTATPPNLPEPMTPTQQSVNFQSPTRTLVIGIGDSGSGVIRSLDNSLAEIYDSMPEAIRWLQVNLQEETSDPNRLELPLDQTVMNLIEQSSRAQEPLPIQNWLPDDTSPNLQNHATGRALRRLMLFVNLRRVKGRIDSELRNLQSKSGGGLTIYLIGSLSGLTGSGLLIDLAHLIRLKAQKEGLQDLSIQAILLLPEAHTTQASLTEQANLRQIAAASWREINRFQSIFDKPYPITYLDEKTFRRGRLFERVYLVGPNQQNASRLRSVPLQSGLYPAIADAIISLSDPVVNQTWEEVARATDTRLNEKQQRYQEPLYRSLGSFTYILPVEDLLERLALLFTEDLVKSLRSGHLDNDPKEVSSLLAQPISPDGRASTQLISSVEAMTSHEDALAYADKQGFKLADWLSAVSENAQQKSTREKVYDLAKSSILRRVLTSDVVRALDYGADTNRVLSEVDMALTKVDQVKSWLKACQSIQHKAFKQLVGKHLTTMMNPASDQFQGVTRTLDFLHTLNARLEEYHEIIAASRSKREQHLAEIKKRAETQRERLKDAVQTTQAKHPAYARAVLQGIIPSAALTLVLGGLSVIIADFSLLFGALAIVGSGVGAWLSYNRLFNSPALIQMQNDYLFAEQEHISAKVELALYQSWENVAKGWQKTAAKFEETFTVWDQNLQTLVDSRLPKLNKLLDNRRKARESIPVRRYLDSQEIESNLYQNFFDATVLDEAQKRLNWHRDEAGWNLQISGTEVSQFQVDSFDDAQTAILKLARTYASRVRSLHIADILSDWHAPQDIAEEIGTRSEPFIRISPHLQPESENCRMVSVQAGSQQEYFDTVTSMLRKPAAQVHTEHLIESVYPHRCGIITSLDVLRLEGLPSWKKSLESYRHTYGKRRSNLHVFPAETNAAQWESLMPQANLQSIVLAPAICLVLENKRRALAFLRALACGWVQERQEMRSGLRSYYAIALTLPESKPALLTKPKTDTPSYWTAAISFVLEIQTARNDILREIESAWETFITPPNSVTKQTAIKQLESAIKRASHMRQSPDQRIAELGLILQLVSEDGLNRLYGEKAILDEI